MFVCINLTQTPYPGSGGNGGGAAVGLPWEAASGPVGLYVNYERYVQF